MEISTKYAIDDSVETTSGDKGLVVGYTFEKQKGLMYIVLIGYEYKYLYDFQIKKETKETKIGFVKK